MPEQKFRWDEFSSGDGAGELLYVMPRKKRARKTETATAQDGQDKSETGTKKGSIDVVRTWKSY